MRAAGVGAVCEMNASPRSAGELPEEVRIDVAEENFTRFGALACAWNVIQHPANLQAAEVGGERQAGLCPKPIGSAVALQIGNVRANPGVLPDQRIVNGLPGRPVPEYCRLALVSDADRREVSRGGGLCCCMASSITSSVRRQISLASCSTHPGCG